MLKKVFISSIAFFVVALAIAGYFIFFKSEATTPDKASEQQEYVPFGEESANRPPVTSTTTNTVNDDTNFNIPITIVTRISSDPATMGIAFTKGNDTLVRYAERAQGHITEVNLTTGTTSRVTITTLPKIQQTLWLNGGASVIYRYLSDLDDIRTYAASIIPSKSTTTPATLKGAFLAGAVEDITASPDLKKIFYIEQSPTGGRGITATYDGTKSKAIWTSPINEWTVAWPENNTVVLTTKASNNVPGYAYNLTVSTGSLKKVLGPLNGLTTLANPSVSLIAYASNGGSLSVVNTKTGASTAIGISTFTEKCVWSKKNKNKLYCAVPQGNIGSNQPDSWYQGRTSFTDTLYEIDAASGIANPIDATRNISRYSMDVSEMTLSPKEDYLIVTNKKDSTLWSIKL
jgi:hypothetical protein